MKETDLGNMFRKAFKSVCTSTIVVSSDPLPSINILNFEDTRKQEDPEPAGEGDIQMEYSSEQLYRQNIGAVTENYL
jgi:hypothetical protein